MYDPFNQELMQDLPDFEGLASDRVRRVLSRAYFALIDLRLRSEPEEVSESLVDDLQFLRRLANTLESRAIFDTDVRTEEQRVSAFVAAEALSLLASLYEVLGFTSDVPTRIEREGVFSRIESALLYMIAGYDANAIGVVRTMPEEVTEPSAVSSFEQAMVQASEWTSEVLIKLCRFRFNPLPEAVCPVEFGESMPDSLIDLEHDVRGRLFARIGEATASYMAWLTGEPEAELESTREQLQQLAQSLAENQHTRNADIHHLARLLLAVFGNTQDRSLIQSVPTPDPADGSVYQSYLRKRAKGSVGGIGRPLLWPSVQKYVETCLPGPEGNAVVSMPTGSGKSFLAELAASQAIQNGWVLYLVPTNALAHQARRDLRDDLDSLEAGVRAFIGDREYTNLEQERVEHVPPRTVAVMTPEKCLLAMRLNPEAFETCRLCIFEECHLLGQETRGPIAELVVSQLMVLASECRFLLMSAMVQNPEELAQWLQEATGDNSHPVTLTWRPTRTLRCAVGVSHEITQRKAQLAKERLENESDWRKNERFESSFAAIAGLQGAWQTDDRLDYAFMRLPERALLQVHREQNDRGEWDYSIKPDGSWVNKTSRRLGEMLAEERIPTIIFLPANKHFPFSVGDDVTLSGQVRQSLTDPSERIHAFLALAEDELGVASEVANLIEKGISVHTAALLDTEQFASEEAFRNGATMVMLATGTLSQGLNLPAIAVIVGGTRIGYTPWQDEETVEQRKLSQLLNASGRAGRAGFSNQGVVIAIPDRPIPFDGPEGAARASRDMAYLRKTDASVGISSPLRGFVDSITSARFNTKTATVDELTLAALLVGGSSEAPEAEDVLQRTYAAYSRRRDGLDDGAHVGATQLANLRYDFVEESGAPQWLPIAAQKAGLDFFLMLMLFQAWKRVQPDLSLPMFEWDTDQWLDTFFETLQLLPPRHFARSFDERTLERFFPELHEIVLKRQWRGNDSDWDPPQEWLSDWQKAKELIQLWMQGETIREMASQLLDVAPADVSGQRSSAAHHCVPKTLSFLKKFVNPLALLAGGFVAMIEGELTEGEEGDSFSELPYAVSTLPLSIKYGCDAPQTLAWYRFGLRFRRAAHLLSRAFPLDPEIQDDHELLESVQELRRRWIRDEVQVPDQLRAEHAELFAAIKIIFTGPPTSA